MDKKNIKSIINNLIQKGETKKALDILLTEKFDKQNKEIVILCNRYHEIKKKSRLGIIILQEEQIELNKINVAVLEILENINESKISSEKNEQNIFTNSNLKTIILSICIVILLIFTVIYYSLKINKPQLEEKILTKSESLNPTSTESFERPENKEIIKESNLEKDLELEQAIKHILSKKPDDSNEFEQLIVNNQFEKALEVIEIAETRTKDKYLLTHLDNRRKSIYLIREHDIDNAWISFPRTLILTVKENKYGLLNRKGEEVCKPKFNEIEPLFFGNLYCTILDSMYGFFNEEGEEIFKTVFSEVNPMIFDEFTLVKKDGLYGLLDIDGNFILEPKFNQIERVMEDLIFTNENEKWGVIDTTGYQILENDYEQLEYIKKEGLIYAVKKGKGEYLDRKGRLTTNPALN
ncbi:WG repeat-containing protein [Chondrinema litorale]|uniref:WG repeat-containing protein n=1 Tax=Chondrinema litorale TaxID=2994555 RepID=UPI0025438D51|nr:WG repeat-containing protein [Chondrinema litorale]UZR98836.1 WG repeat-containing protein [Chondrinema litorale]